MTGKTHHDVLKLYRGVPRQRSLEEAEARSWKGAAGFGGRPASAAAAAGSPPARRLFRGGGRGRSPARFLL